MPEPDTTWYDGPPWFGDIPFAEFRALIALYIEHHGYYAPDLPRDAPALLEAWLEVHYPD